MLWRIIPDDLAPGRGHRPTWSAPSATTCSPRPPPAPASTCSVTGQVAIQIDFSDYLAARLPLFFGVVLGLSFLLLMVVFRSLLVPLKAVIMNLLSIGAAYGVLVAVFQWGWLSGPLGLEGAPIEPFMPMMLFAIVFGLSMDYEVFLLSRIQEEWRPHRRHRTRRWPTAWPPPPGSSPPPPPSWCSSSAASCSSDDRVVKLMGLGLAVAVLLDATIVRMLLVPATMELLGDRNWWLPRLARPAPPPRRRRGPASPSDELEPERETTGVI